MAIEWYRIDKVEGGCLVTIKPNKKAIVQGAISIELYDLIDSLLNENISNIVPGCPMNVFSCPNHSNNTYNRK